MSGSVCATEPWRTKLLRGRFDGKAWRGGFAISLAENWKTYWRVPGAGGIAPDFQASGENLLAFAVQLPLPHRFVSEGGDIIGYKNEVVFPFLAEVRKPLSPVILNLDAFLGVCDAVCIPVKVSHQVTFDPTKSELADDAMIERWLYRVPKIVQGTGPIQSARLGSDDGKMILSLELSEQPDDIFVEGQPLHYFHAPTLMRGVAFLQISGANSRDDVRKSPLRVTLSIGGLGVEQWISLT
jgi:DsbC/DsbD-like thiol-disulfide interchange protein